MKAEILVKEERISKKEENLDVRITKMEEKRSEIRREKRKVFRNSKMN